MTLTIDDLAADGGEEPGFLNFGSFGPVSGAVLDEERAFRHVHEHARPGALATFGEQDARVRGAVARLVGRSPAQVAFQSNTSQGLMHTMFGVTGPVAFSPAEFPSIPFAVARAAGALHVLEPRPLAVDRGSDHGRVTPGVLRDQLDGCVAVALSLVDFRTGYLADLEGIRQVIGDRLLIVDAIQGFGVVDAAYELADVVVSGGQKWVRAGWGTGFLALSDRAIEELTPVWSGFFGVEGDELPLDAVPPPAAGAGAYTISQPDPVAEARLATALERIEEVGLAAVSERLAERVDAVLALLDDAGVPVVSPRATGERAGLVVSRPAPEHLTALAAALLNHGVSATVRAGSIRFAPHVSTTDETLDMLRSALVEFRTVASL